VPSQLQDHIRNDVAVRSIAGSVVLKDCTLLVTHQTRHRFR